MKRRLIFSSLLLVLLAFGLNGLFNYTSLDKYAVEAMSARYAVFLREFSRHIEMGQHFGKSIHNFEGIHRRLSEVRHNIISMHVGGNPRDPMNEDAFSGADIHFSLVGKDRRVIASTDSRRDGMIAPADTKIAFAGVSDLETGKRRMAFNRSGSRFFVTGPILDGKGQWAATMLLDLPLPYVASARNRLAESLIRPFALIVTATLLLMGLVPALAPVSDPQHPGEVRKGMVALIVIIFCTGQLVCSGFLSKRFAGHFLDNVRQENRLLAAIIRDNVQYCLDLGIDLERLAGMKEFLGGVLARENQAGAIQVTMDTGTVIADTDQEIGVFPNPSPVDNSLHRFKIDREGGALSAPSRMELTLEYATVTFFGARERLTGADMHQATVTVVPSLRHIRRQIFGIFLDAFTVSIISILFFGELLLLSVKLAQARKPKTALSQPQPIHFSVMRAAAFLFLFGIDISISFMPLHMERLSESFFGLSKDVVMGIPISTEFLFVGFSILAAGVWLDRRGWHEPFITGVLLAAAGGLYSRTAPNALHLIVSRAVVGTGYGLALMASQGFVITFSDNRSKAQGLASLFAGIYAGSICGGATGGMLAERLGYQAVFLCGALLLLGVALYTVIFMRDAFQRPVALTIRQPERISPQISRKSNLTNFLFDRSVLGLMLFSSLPAAIAVVGFLNYFAPIYLNRLGVSQSNIGRVLMIYGVCLIYFGSFISRYVDSSMSKKYYIFFGCMLGCGAFLMFGVFHGLAVATLAILLLGISNCFILASQSAYALKMDVTRSLGEGKAIGIFRSTSRMGQMLGPILFGWVIVATNINKGITYIGLAYFATALLFLFIAKHDKRFALTEVR